MLTLLHYEFLLNVISIVKTINENLRETHRTPFSSRGLVSSILQSLAYINLECGAGESVDK